jgi:cytosol alanyl aminopeptidase
MQHRPLIGALHALLLITLTACGWPTPAPLALAEATTESSVPSGQLGGAVMPQRYQLDLTIQPDQEHFSGSVSIDLDIRAPTQLIWLHGKELDVREVWLATGEQRIAGTYTQVDATGVAKVELQDVAPAGPARLHFTYVAPFNRALEGLYKVTEQGEDYAFTQFQATSARLVFPGFDEPVFKTPFDIRITARAEHAVITAMPEETLEVLADGLVRRQFAVSPPLPTYLIAFAVGPLDVVEWAPVPPNEVRQRPLPLRGIAARGKGDRMTYALDNTAALVEALERYFDYPMPYPKLDLIAVPDFAAGAMENVGAITYREQFLLLGAAPSVGEQRSYASIHAHELAHQWFGNLVTPKWWDDIWLNESFATWMATKAAAEVFPTFGFQADSLTRTLGVMGADSLASARQIRQAILSNHDIAGAFDGITYSKGGGVLSMLEAWLGEDTFRKGVRLHLRRFEHGVADVDDFLRSMADASGNDGVVEVFHSFLFQPGVPLLRVALDCAGERPALTLRQSRYLPLGSMASSEHRWHIPVCVRYADADGGAAERHCQLMSTSSARIELPVAHCPAWVMPNADGSGYYRVALDAEGWAALFAHFEALNGNEARTLLASLSAAYHSGNVTTATLVDALPMLASHPDRQVATAPLADLQTLHERLAPTPEIRANVEALVRDLYGARQRDLGLGARPTDSADEALLRASLTHAVAVLGRDRDLRARLTAAASGYLATLQVDPDQIDPGVIDTMLEVAVEERGAQFANGLLETLLVSDDATFRSRALGALANSPDPAVGARLRALIGDARLRSNEAINVALVQAANEWQRDAVWTWIQNEENRDQLLARIPAWRKGSIARIGGEFCDEARAAEVEAWFAPLSGSLEGGPRALAQTVESIRLCAALVEVHADAVADYFR